ncbi:methylenetetrahydrofolate reductase C-terminal domain-containing protein [Chloroflexota bacterium]
MEKAYQILVIASESSFIEMTERAFEPFEVIYASNEKEGLEKARKELPDIIVLGHSEPQGTTFKLHRKLQEGWITRNIPLLVVDVGSPDRSRRALSIEERPQIEAGEYISLPDAELIVELREKLNSKLRVRANIFRDAILAPDTFCITWEQVPGRGAFEMEQEEVIENARRAAKGGRIHAVSITDNPSGNPAISAEILCSEVRKLGIEPLVHFAFRDKNRNQCESLLWGLAALTVRNLLLLTGDYPSDIGFKGRAKPVFDLDSVHGLQLVKMMNSGIEYEVMGRKATLAKTDFFAGASISPFKQSEAELMGQYYKLKKKIEAGAEFITLQLGYDARKFHEVLLWLKVHGYNIPVLANIYVLPYGVAKTMHANQIPGAIVTDKLLAEIAEERNAKDKGRSARLTRAAKMYALAKGMGYAGVHIGGYKLTYEMVEFIIERGEELAQHWRELITEFDYPQTNGSYFFKKDPETGLNTEIIAKRTQKPKAPFIYWVSLGTHLTIFNPKSIIFKMLLPLARAIDKTTTLKRFFGWGENVAKTAMFTCMDCGDCGLFDVAYLCPVSQCPKNQRNGPCGGSHEGWCEVYPDEKKCIWVKAYERLRATHNEDEIGASITPPLNWELWETSSWLNFYNGRDHNAKRLGVKPPKDKHLSEEAGTAKGTREAT